jgi:hypothetical protein
MKGDASIFSRESLLLEACDDQSSEVHSKWGEGKLIHHYASTLKQRKLGRKLAKTAPGSAGRLLLG